MRRLLLNLATLLALLLSAAAVWMSARSRHVTEAWVCKPRPSGIVFEGSGWHVQRELESSGGRLVYVSYNRFVKGEDPPEVGGYCPSARETLTPLRYDRRLPKAPSFLIPPATNSGQLAGVVEWRDTPRYAYIGAGRHVAVTWSAVAVVFALAAVTPHVARKLLGWYRRRRQRRRAAAFPVIASAAPP
jgi:hypothetical protein